MMIQNHSFMVWSPHVLTIAIPCPLVYHRHYSKWIAKSAEYWSIPCSIFSIFHILHPCDETSWLNTIGLYGFKFYHIIQINWMVRTSEPHCCWESLSIHHQGRAPQSPKSPYSINSPKCLEIVMRQKRSQCMQPMNCGIFEMLLHYLFLGSISILTFPL